MPDPRPRGRDYRGAIAGVAEAAEIVGVSRQRLHELRQRPDFPAVAFDLASGLTWWVEDLRAYAKRPRPAGRPKRESA